MPEILYPNHNHLQTEPCTDKCPNFRAQCPLCTIPQTETPIYQDAHIYLIQTRDMKGHKVRVMACIQRHASVPTFVEQVKIIGILVEHMQSLLQGKDFYIISPQYASVPQHYHLIACDTPLEDEEDPMFYKTPKIVFPIKGGKPCP